MVEFKTTLGTILIELDAAKAPKSVENFLAYVKSGFYDGTIFHRVIDGFVIQGGGLDASMKEKATQPPIPNEGKNGLLNDAYTLSMARTSNPDSATSQFFINLVNNTRLDYKSDGQPGYAVFAKVVGGDDVVRKIAASKTTTKGMYQDVPETPVVIEKATIVEKK